MGQTQDNSSGSQNTNRAAIVGGVIAAVVTLCLSIIGFIMWTLWRKNRAMKAALAEHERDEDEVNMAQFVPTPYPVSIPSLYSATPDPIRVSLVCSFRARTECRRRCKLSYTPKSVDL